MKRVDKDVCMWVATSEVIIESDSEAFEVPKYQEICNKMCIFMYQHLFYYFSGILNKKLNLKKIVIIIFIFCIYVENVLFHYNLVFT